MFITGQVVVHKSDGVTRECRAAKISEGGNLAVWDEIPDDEVTFGTVSPGTGIQLIDLRTEEIIEPDIIVTSDMWQRVERDGHSWKQTSVASIKNRAERRDDVDEDEIDL